MIDYGCSKTVNVNELKSVDLFGSVPPFVRRQIIEGMVQQRTSDWPTDMLFRMANVLLEGFRFPCHIVGIVPGIDCDTVGDICSFLHNRSMKARLLEHKVLRILFGLPRADGGATVECMQPEPLTDWEN